MDQIRVLVVEDEILVARDLQTKLQRAGFDVPEIVDTGAAALEKVAELKPDLVLMDIRIKGDFDGVEAASRIKESHRIPVVYLTAYADDTTVERAKITTPFGYILKPFQLKELKTTIEIALYRHEMESALRAAHEKLAQQVRELDARDRLVHFQMSGPTMSEAWHEILVVFHQVFAADRAVVFWPNEAETELNPVSVLDGGDENTAGDRPADPDAVLLGGDAIIARAFAEGQPCRQEDDRQVAVPVVYRDTVMGVVWLQEKANGAAPGEDELSALWRLAEQAALLLRMARVGDDLSDGRLEVSDLIELASGELDGQGE